MAKKSKPFDASMFTATEFSTAEEKAKLGNQLLVFIDAGFPESKFTKALYNTLHLHFGFIAHYNQSGFWATYFTNTVDKIEFLKHILENPCYGSPAYTWSDVERAVKVALKSKGVLARYQALNSEEIEQSERRMLARLKAKYEPENGPAVTGENIPPLADFTSKPGEQKIVTEIAAIQPLLF